ncbi:MAG: hypothetical protein PXY39_07685 [archaeon]|nr:hypothetical protein [archaeon]
MPIIKDDTLREGMQTPGVMFTPKEKMEIATRLVRCGLRRLLVSYAPAHSSEVIFTSDLVERTKTQNVQVFSLGRGIKEDVDVIASTGANISITTPFDGTYSKTLDAARYSKDRYPDRLLTVGLTDVASYSNNSLADVAKEFDKAGVDFLELPDTTGKLHPSRYGQIIRDVRKQITAKIAVHCHNDYGLSIANSLAGIEAGADEIDATVLGLGERNGIADLLIIAKSLELQGVRTGVDVPGLEEIYQFVNDLFRSKTKNSVLNDRYPVIGSFLKVHTAGTHATNVNKFAGAYSVNVYCGRSLVKSILSEYRIFLREDQLSRLVTAIKDLSAAEGRVLSYDEVVSLSRKISSAK